MSPKKRASTFTGKLLIALVAIALPCFGQAPDEQDLRLLTVKKLCVEKFVGKDGQRDEAREMAIASLFASKRFAVTENCEKADATLKGAVSEKATKKVRAEGEAADFGAAAGGASANRNSAAAAIGAVVGGSSESLLSAESGSIASVTLRIVDKEGEVIWAYSQDSPGGKVKTPLADAVGRAVRQLQRDLERLQKRREGTSR